MRRLSRIWLYVASGVGALLLVVLVLLLNLQWFRGPIERAITASTGREAHIRGELRLWPLLPPRLIAGDVTLANAPWSQEGPMFSARRIAIRPFFWRTLRGQLAFRSLEGEGLHLLVETDAENHGNWQFEPAKSQPQKAASREPLEIEIRQLVLRDSQLRVHEAALQTELTLAASTEPAPVARFNRLRLNGKGTYRTAPFALDGRFDLPTDIDADELQVPLEIDATAGSTHLHAAGTLPAAITTLGAKLDVKLSGDSLGDLYQLAGVALPETPPYELAGALGWKGQRVTWNGFEGKIGDSQMSGDAALEFGGERPRLTAKLQSSLLDFDDLGALFGIPPATGEGETISPAQKQEKATLASRGRVLPTSEFDFGKLNSLDADVTLVAERIQAPKLPLRTLNARVQLKEGVLKLDPFDFAAAGGTLQTRISFDARRKPLAYEFAIDLKKVKLAELVPQAESLKDAVGRIDGNVRLKGTGNSVAAMFASADGQLQAIMGQGEVSNLLLELAGLDVAEALKFLLGKDHKVAVRCAYVDFKVVQGVAGAEAFALDTTDTALLGKGSIDLREERFDLTLLPKPKDKSPISLRSPLKIGGNFLDPSFRPEAGPLLLRGAVVAALASLAPPAALLGLLETGPGHDVACGPGQRAGTADKGEAEAKSPATAPGPRPAPVTRRPAG